MKQLIERVNRYRFSLSAVIVLGLACSAFAQPKSDYEIVK